MAWRGTSQDFNPTNSLTKLICSAQARRLYFFTVCRAVTINSRDFNVCSEICEIGRWLVVVVLGDNFSLTVDFQLWKVLVKYTSAQG